MGDMTNAACMADHFEKIQKLPDPIPGCPNFRRVPGYKVYCCGQPTIAGFEATLNIVCGDVYPKDGKIIWLNLWQEPDVYFYVNETQRAEAQYERSRWAVMWGLKLKYKYNSSM